MQLENWELGQARHGYLCLCWRMISFSEEGLFEELHEDHHGDRPREYELVSGATNQLPA